MMVHVEQDNKIVQFSHLVILIYHIDVFPEDVLKIKLYVHNWINK